MEKYGTAGQATDVNKLRCTRFACWIAKAIGTHPEYVIKYLLLCMVTMVSRTRLNVTFTRTLPNLLQPHGRLFSAWQEINR